MHIKIGTRGSKLAMWQAEFVKGELEAAGHSTEIIQIVTKGDTILDTQLSKIGSKGVFTLEIEEKLLTGEIDIAVHSAKDLQSDLGPNFEIIAFTEREKVNDVIISHKEIDLSKPYVLGTSSTRRLALLHRYYPYVNPVDVRGNLQTRIQKMKDGHCDALLLAYAGVHRMHYTSMIKQILPADTFCTPVGQGSIAIEISKSMEPSSKEAIKAVLNHPSTEQLMLVERSFLYHMNGGCSIPVFGRAYFLDQKLHFHAGIISLDGQRLISHTMEGSNNEHLGKLMADKVLNDGGREILKDIRK